MIKTKTEANSKIDWKSGCYVGGTTKKDDQGESGIIAPIMHNETETLMDARKHYFDMLRRFLTEIEAITEDENSFAHDTRAKIKKVFNKYDVHFVDVDDIKRVNIDEPIQ